ncbi:MAG: transmembrane 220 family protein [Flavobacteriaceae bacterium]
MNNFFKVFGWIFGILCIVSAVLQYNDPDPLIWIIIYGLAALASIAFALDRLPNWPLMVLGVVYALGFLAVFPEEFVGFSLSSGDWKNVEEGRESFGLLILALVLLLFSFWGWYRKKAALKV